MKKTRSSFKCILPDMHPSWYWNNPWPCVHAVCTAFPLGMEKLCWGLDWVLRYRCLCVQDLLLSVNDRVLLCSVILGWADANEPPISSLIFSVFPFSPATVNVWSTRQEGTCAKRQRLNPQLDSSRTIYKSRTLTPQSVATCSGSPPLSSKK